MKKFPGQAKNEKILFFSKENIIAYLTRKIPIIFVAFFLMGFVFVIGYYIFEELTITFLVVFIIFLTLFFILYLLWSKTYVIVTNKRVLKFVRNGLFSEHFKELKINQISEITSRKMGIFEKILRIGNIKLVSKDSETVIWFQGILYPKEVAMYISRLKDFLIENPDFDFQKLIEFKPKKERKKNIDN